MTKAKALACGPGALALVFLTVFLSGLLAGVWTGDDRWAISGLIFTIPAIVCLIAWLSAKFN